MMKTVLILTALVFAPTHPAIAQGEPKGGRATAQQALRAARPGLTWRHVRTLDINCDGMRDDIFTARDSIHYYVAAVIARGGGAMRASVVQFQLAGNSQESFCGRPEPLKTESQDIDFPENVGEPAPQGFRRSTRCLGLRLAAGECDSFHLYWNHTSGQLDWWRL